MIPLLERRNGALRPVLPADRDVTAWHGALTREITAHLTPAHAALLAAPTRTETGIAWFAPGSAMRRYEDLDATSRDQLTAATGAILSDIRRLAESRLAPSVAAAWPALRTIPDLTYLSVVDGRPVLAGWGFAAQSGGAGPLLPFDDGVAWKAPIRIAWLVYAAALVALAVLAVFTGVALTPVLGLVVPEAPVCRADPAQLALLRDQSEEENRGDALKAELAQLREARGDRALACPIPRQAALVPPPIPHVPRVDPTPQRPPEPRADLPQDRWNDHDLKMLKGCWKRYTNMKLVVVGSGRVLTVTDWELCFDNAGHGKQTIVLDSGARCSSNLDAHFNNDDTLEFNEPERCIFDRGSVRTKLRSKAVCQRESDIEATCDMTETEGANTKGVSTGRFRRADAPPP